MILKFPTVKTVAPTQRTATQFATQFRVPPRPHAVAAFGALHVFTSGGLC
jgi:hypothetical protein